MKVVYIAGPFRAPNAWAIAENVREAERWGLEVARCGAMPLIPHANTAHFHGMLDDAFWLLGTLALMARCDGVLMIPRWASSTGALAEHDAAKAAGMRVWLWDSPTWRDEVRAWS